MTRCDVAFGGNLGDVPATFRAAADVLAREAGAVTVRRSRLYRTTPVGTGAGERYWNALAALETDVSPDDLLTLLQEIEHLYGRTRTAHWGPRTLDLDLVACGPITRSTPRLTLPHPHAWYRRFVLDPWCDVAADARHPLLGETVAELRERLLVRPLPVCVAFSGDVAEAVGRMEGIVLVDADQSPVITFAEQRDPARRRVGLGGIEKPAEFASQVVRAATDEPFVVGGGDWMSDDETER